MANNEKWSEQVWVDVKSLATDHECCGCLLGYVGPPVLAEQPERFIEYHRADLATQKLETLRAKIEEWKKEPERVAMAALDKDQPQIWQRASGQVMAYNDVLSFLAALEARLESPSKEE